MEIWKDVVGFEDTFQISNSGKLFSKRTNKELKQSLSKKGYLLVSTKIGGRTGKSLCFRVHRLVAEAFLENLECKPFVNHKDGNKQNNKLSNLEWCTASENTIHAYENNLMNNEGGCDRHNAKLSEDDLKSVRELLKKGDKTHNQIAEMFGIARSTITNISNGKRYKEG